MTNLTIPSFLRSLIDTNNNKNIRPKGKINNINTNNHIQTKNNIKNKNFIGRSVASFFKGGLTELKFKNNVLNIKEGVNYKAKTFFSGDAEFTIKDYKLTKLMQVIGIDDSEIFSNQELDDIGRTEQFIELLAGEYPIDKKLMLLRTFYPNPLDRKIRLEKLGAECNKEISFNGCSENLYFDESGWLYTKEELKNLRGAYLERNFFEYGYNENSEIIIDGKEYKLDETGHISGIPEDAICIHGKVKLIK
ncbi:hypothetical protein [Clostridium ihumii]|uniref:hypothetical protein n=1 Tax=Clostridium ihumii TaxID=1470356 RepID=UPI00058C7419|nr:hypothetical protein [Clostridium ihumii]